MNHVYTSVKAGAPQVESEYTSDTWTLTVPCGRIEQCCNGHLMCAEAEPAPEGPYPARGGDVAMSCCEQVRATRGPKCPVCRVVLKNAIRALVAEQAIAALPSRCRHCEDVMSRDALKSHEPRCPRAPVTCGGSGDEGGCGWTGPREERDAHVATCVWGREQRTR